MDQARQQIDRFAQTEEELLVQRIQHQDFYRQITWIVLDAIYRVFKDQLSTPITLNPTVLVFSLVVNTEITAKSSCHNQVLRSFKKHITTLDIQ